VKPAAIDPPEVWPQLWKDVTGTVGYDIGANCGQTIPVMLERFKQVYAFEPAEECWSYLNDIDGNLTWLPIGLSDTDDNVDLICLPDKIDTGQLVTAGTHGMEWNPDRPGAQIRTIICRTIDTLILRGETLPPDFMKIDVEGHELRVLFGARQTLAVHRPELLVEFHSQQLHSSIKRCSNSSATTAPPSDTPTTGPEPPSGSPTAGSRPPNDRRGSIARTDRRRRSTHRLRTTQGRRDLPDPQNRQAVFNTDDYRTVINYTDR
jgi:FkbM family methyltransferase